MLLDRRILAVVPARSGSKGIADKNMRQLDGVSLIGFAGQCLQTLPWIDRKIISTDSDEYAKEAQRYELSAPFLRPSKISNDSATAVDMMIHALQACEQQDACQYDILVLVEPTSPFRQANDIEQTCRGMIDGAFDSAVCVSLADTKSHPLKMLKVKSNKLDYYEKAAADITARQQLAPIYIRNGACYAVSRDTLLGQRSIITNNTFAYVVDREMVNIDDPVDLEWAQFLLDRKRKNNNS